MVLLARYSTVAGIPLPDLVEMGWTTKEKLDGIIQRTRDGGAEIVGLLKTGSAFTHLLHQQLKWLKLISRTKNASYLVLLIVKINLALKVCMLGYHRSLVQNGIERIVEIKLSKDEQIMFDKSVQAVNSLVKACKEMDKTLA